VVWLLAWGCSVEASALRLGVAVPSGKGGFFRSADPKGKESMKGACSAYKKGMLHDDDASEGGLLRPEDDGV
jgi:hypothetical protein